MVKTDNQLIAELNNLELAFWKAQRSKSTKSSVIDLRKNLSKNLLEVRKDLLENNVSLGDYHYFTIYDPKEGMICAADFRERVIQHAVANICNRTFEKYQIYDSYASRKGKGVDSCLRRALEFCKRYKWYLKLDIHKFYDSIHHKILLQILNKRFKDNLLLKFFSDLIDTYQVSNDRGIPIGNLLSQYFANMYLAVLDHEIKERIRVKGYLRYMDDFLCFSDDKYFLIQVQNRIENYVDNNLLLCLNKPQLNKCCYGIPFTSSRVNSKAVKGSQNIGVKDEKNTIYIYVFSCNRIYRLWLQ